MFAMFNKIVSGGPFIISLQVRCATAGARLCLRGENPDDSF